MIKMKSSVTGRSQAYSLFALAIILLIRGKVDVTLTYDSLREAADD